MFREIIPSKHIDFPYTFPMITDSPETTSKVLLPDAPVLAVGLKHMVWFSPDGEIEELDAREAGHRTKQARPILCHMPQAASRLGIDYFRSHDVLELFAFVRPATFCLPTPAGLAEILDLDKPETLEAQAAVLIQAARRLLGELRHLPAKDHRRAASIAWAMGRGQWSWAPYVLAALDVPAEGPHRATVGAGLRVWEHLPKWEERPPEPPPGSEPVTDAEARARLSGLLGEGAEGRPQQADYASACTSAFAPADAPGNPHLVLAEAGTGVGKTLGYIAPASVWADKNEGPVWVSTFTRNLQRQLDGEMDRLYPDKNEKRRHVVVRKGRENYLCLLNLEEAAQRLHAQPHEAAALGLMARWALATRDGDMIGGDFPAWLPDLVGRNRTLGLMDRRGECIYSACSHFQVCFIERTIRRAKRAKMVVANHALVMIQAALGGTEGDTLPTRIVFDEGHHLFAAADSAFAAHLSGLEGADLRRWLLGAEGETTKSRARGLKSRAEEIVGDSQEAANALSEIVGAARVLPGPGWLQRLTTNQPFGPAETFLAHARRQVFARAKGADGPYSLEAETGPPVDGLVEAANRLHTALGALLDPLKVFAKATLKRLDEEAEDLEAAERQRIEGIAKSIERRALLPLVAWRDMLDALNSETPHEFVDWFAVERSAGREIDVGLFRHWVDPTLPMAQALSGTTHGLLVTSATLRDGTGDEDTDWAAAEDATGANHFALPAVRAKVPSPFDYPNATRVLIVNDLNKNDAAQVSAAYRELFLASGGGALGLFTAISRLRTVHQRIAEAMETAHIPLYAQHVDGLDPAALVDIFRAEEEACLLGTDALRDGVDVPGRSLRLVVFDRTPWPRPDILHKARRAAFGGRSYEDRITRMRLKQAFGRLIRRGGDKGVFVMLDGSLPSRLLGAFPEGVEVQRLGLRDAVALTRDFLHPA